jgi:hypothetical protein
MALSMESLARIHEFGKDVEQNLGLSKHWGGRAGVGRALNSNAHRPQAQHNDSVPKNRLKQQI